jgi:non-ribosomal peptide synthetase component F
MIRRQRPASPDGLYLRGERTTACPCGGTTRHSPFRARLVRTQAELTPDACAVMQGDRRWSYRELERRANGLARFLRRVGVAPEVKVAVRLEPSPELLASLLGVLKAGGAYVPIAPSMPPERVARLLDSCGASMVITERGLSMVPQGKPSFDRIPLRRASPRRTISPT